MYETQRKCRRIRQPNRAGSAEIRGLYRATCLCDSKEAGSVHHGWVGSIAVEAPAQMSAEGLQVFGGNDAGVVHAGAVSSAGWSSQLFADDRLLTGDGLQSRWYPVGLPVGAIQDVGIRTRAVHAEVDDELFAGRRRQPVAPLVRVARGL